MATVPKAEVNNEMKQEPKEQREQKKPGSPKLDQSSPKGSPSLERKQLKENSPKKETSPNKPTEQAKPPEQKSAVAKGASSPVKKENAEQPKSPKSNPEQPKSPKSNPEQPKSPKSNPEQPKSPEPTKSEKKDVVAGDRAVTPPKVAENKPSSPEKVNAPNGTSTASNSSKLAGDRAVTPPNKVTENKPSSPEKVNAPNATSTATGSPKLAGDKAVTPPKVIENKPSSPEKVDAPNGTSAATGSSKLADSTNNSDLDKNSSNGKTLQNDAENISPPTNVLHDNEMETTNKKNEESDTNNNKQTEEKDKSPSKNGTHDSKNKLRMEIWNKMFRSSLLAYRKPCNYRIPHFKGDIISAGRLSTLEIFQKAKIVKVSLDKAHECVRLQVIEAGKEMIVGCPGLREAVFLHVKPPMEPSKSSNKLASSKIGIGHIGMALDFSSNVQADLVIVGSVAVDRTGLRVGKGEGFADLEYALLKKLGGIAPNAPIVTVVHDSQVYDTLPENLFKEHDVPADYIVTPTEVIEITPKRKHPDLIWNILSSRRVNSIPIIKQLLDREKNRDGANVLLKEEDTDSEELEEIAKRKKYFMRRRTYSTGSQRGRGQMVNAPNNNRNSPRGRIRRHTAPSEKSYQQQPRMMMFSPPLRPNRNFRRRAASVPRYNFIQQQNMKQNRYWVPMKFQNGGHQRRNRFRMFRPKYSVDFSVKVQGLTNEMRVRDLKSAIKQRGIRPRDISWLPHKGLAFLHFSLPKNNINESQPTVPVARDTDSVLATLKNLMVKTETGPETNVQVEAAAVPARKVHFTV